MSCTSFQTSETPFSSESASNTGSSRESSPFAQAVQRVENCLTAMQKINEQIAGLAEQRRKVQDELRGIQCQMNEEFDRILKPARAPSSAPAKVVARNVPGGAEMKPALRMDSRQDARLDLMEDASELAARAAS